MHNPQSTIPQPDTYDSISARYGIDAEALEREIDAERERALRIRIHA